MGPGQSPVLGLTSCISLGHMPQQWDLAPPRSCVVRTDQGSERTLLLLPSSVHLPWLRFLPGVWGSTFSGSEIAQRYFTEEGHMSSKFALRPIRASWRSRVTQIKTFDP